MTRYRWMAYGAWFVASLLTGCAAPAPVERLNSPPQGFHDTPSSLSDPFVYMADNAMLHDLSIADIHFIPHSSELSGTGAARLNRLSRLLHVYGGDVHYETFEDDEPLIQERLAHVRDYLTQAGCDMSRVQVETGIARGRGMKATQAIEVMKKGTKKPDGGGSGQGAMPGLPGASS